ncbi:MAG: EutN/CcmL family microcompartment protein [Armatimonadota bacterium]
MVIGKVLGTVVCTQKSSRLDGVKLQIVQPIDVNTLKLEGKSLVAIDTVGAGEGEIVMLVSGSSARQTETTNNTPTDAAIIAILDTIEVDGSVLYDKSKERISGSKK